MARLASAPALRPSDACFGYFPTWLSVCMIAAMNPKDRLLAQLSSARTQLVLQQDDAARKLDEARTALWIATTAVIGAGIPADSSGGEAPMTAAQLLKLVKQCEAELARTHDLLAQIDARLAQLTLAEPGTAP